MVTIRHLLKDYDAAHRVFRLTLNGLRPEQRMQPHLIGDWGLREIVLHLAAWQEEGATALREMLAGTRGDVEYDDDAWNAEQLARHAGMDLEAGVRWLEEAYREFRGLLDGVPEDLLAGDPRVDEWAQGLILHYHRHGSELRHL